MGEDIRKNASTIFFKILVTADVLSLLLCLTFALFFHPPYGTYLTESYLSTLRSYEICSAAFYSFGMFFLLLSAACICTLLFGRNIFTYVLVVAAVVVSLLFIRPAVPYILHKPEVVKTVCVSKDVYYKGNEDIEVQEYWLFFKNGASSKVSKSLFSNAVGKSFYVIMCGDEAVRVFDSEQYSLSPDP